MHKEVNVQQESSVERIANFNTQQSFISSIFKSNKTGKGPRVLKMADYFSAGAESSLVLKEEDLKKVERDILNNVDINFVFAKGQGLTEGLIDCDRVYHIVLKIKEVAKQQLSSNSRDIDYELIVSYLKEKD